MYIWNLNKINIQTKFKQTHRYKIDTKNRGDGGWETEKINAGIKTYKLAVTKYLQ